MAETDPKSVQDLTAVVGLKMNIIVVVCKARLMLGHVYLFYLR